MEKCFLALALLITTPNVLLAEDYSGEYFLRRQGFTGGINLIKTNKNEYEFTMNVINWQLRSGILEGKIEFKDGKAIFKETKILDETTKPFECYLLFKFKNNKLWIYQSYEKGQGCGTPINVEYTGVYKKGIGIGNFNNKTLIPKSEIEKEFSKK